MIDENGYRPNVGIIVANSNGSVLWAKRTGQEAWQFPQGGIKSAESPEDALYRELHEEVGLADEQVEVVGATKGWLRYKLPRQLLRDNKSSFVGQKQKWFLLRLISDDSKINFANSEKPEFDSWQWVSETKPIEIVIDFKKDVYKKALEELIPIIKN